MTWWPWETFWLGSAGAWLILAVIHAVKGDGDGLTAFAAALASFALARTCDKGSR